MEKAISIQQKSLDIYKGLGIVEVQALVLMDISKINSLAKSFSK